MPVCKHSFAISRSLALVLLVACDVESDEPDEPRPTTIVPVRPLATPVAEPASTTLDSHWQDAGHEPLDHASIDAPDQRGEPRDRPDVLVCTEWSAEELDLVHASLRQIYPREDEQAQPTGAVYSADYSRVFVTTDDVLALDCESRDERTR